MPTRLDALPTDVIRRQVGAQAYDLGARIARSGKVLQIEYGPAVDAQLHARVQGSAARPYSVAVVGRGDAFRSSCSCPMKYDCKHVAAALVHARQEAALRPKSPNGSVAPPAPLWQRRLNPVVAPHRTAAPGEPLALLVEVVDVPARPGSAHRDARRLRLRPLVRGLRGGWIKSGISWLDLRSGPHFRACDTKQVAALRPMIQAVTAGAAQRGLGVGYYGDGDTIGAHEVGPALFDLIARARSAGVTLVGKHDQPVTLLDPHVAAVDVTAAQDGGLNLRTVVRGGDGDVSLARLDLVGDPASGAFTDDVELQERLAPDLPPGGLLLVPFEEPVAAEVVSSCGGSQPLHVPAQDRLTFLSAYYPALARVVRLVSSDASVTPPDLRPPVVAVTVTYTGLDADLDWGFDYHVDGTVTRVPLAAGPSDVLRDPDAERRLLDGLPGEAAAYVGISARLKGITAVAFTHDVLPVLQGLDDVEVTVVGEVPDFRESEAAPVVTMSAGETKGHRDWFDLGVTVSVDGEPVPFLQLFRALAEGQTHLVLPTGVYLTLDSPELVTLRELIDEATHLQDKPSESLQVSVYQAGLWEDLLRLGVIESQSERWQAAVRGLLELEQVEPPPTPEGLTATLRPYQREGFQWLAFLWQHRLGGILADDMGLGKTVQTLAMVCHAVETGTVARPFLVVAPTSVVGNWCREASRFAPGLTVRAVTTTTRKRGTPLADEVKGADIVVTSYALLRLDEDAFAGLDWAGLVLDEAQFVKNAQSKTYLAARKVPAPFKLGVTGTPLENSLMDLWSLLSIAAPGLYPSPQRFNADYRRPIERGVAPELLERLRRRVRPVMLRRTKEQVVADLPPKQEQTLEVVLNARQERVYQTHLHRERRKVLGLLDDLQRNRFEILSSLTLLRQLSLAPGLVDEAYADVPPSKLDVLLDTLSEVVAEGHKVLVFSQFTRFLQLARERLADAGVAYAYLDGRTRKRAEAIAAFTHGGADVFLVSLKAGGVGLNLTQADYVFLLDPWWNPAVEAQAVDRTHRIGQERPVMVYRLVSAGTVEEKVMELKARKQALFNSVMSDEGVMSGALTVEDIRGLLG